MLFSIIVPIYNVQPYLEKCVTHLREQTLRDIEIILVDDESPDACPEMCDRYAAEDGRIKVIHKKNGGLSDARNHGFAAATGEYILFVDADDYIDRDTCQRLSRYAHTGADLLLGRAVVEGGECDLRRADVGEEVYSGTEYLKKALRAGKRPMAAWLNAYRREFLLENDLSFKYGILHEDEQFTPRVFLKAGAVVDTGETFYHYMIREGSITQKKDKRKNAEHLFSTFCELEGIYREIGDEELRERLLDTLAEKYMNIFQVGELYRYGRQYLHGDFLRRTATQRKTRMKVWLIMLSPRLYFVVNRMEKRLRR